MKNKKYKIMPSLNLRSILIFIKRNHKMKGKKWILKLKTSFKIMIKKKKIKEKNNI